MTEKLLQFIWQFGYYNKASLSTTAGEALSILFAGSHNTNQGPDFINGKIKIGNTTLAGTIELHLKTSDWRKHRHDDDKNYKNVVLHVVFEDDEKVNDVPVLVLGSRISNLLLNRYTMFQANSSGFACNDGIESVSTLVFLAWKERLLIERLTRKANEVIQELTQTNYHWEETFWRLLAKNFGSKINGDAFSAMARSISVNILAKHKSSIHQLEALMFGQSNLLNEEFEEEYPKLLQREYNFLKKKYGLKETSIPIHFLRMRPGNFPTIRLAQLAMLVHQTSHLFSTVLKAEDATVIRQLLSVTANDFWHYHYTFRQASAFKKKTLGAETINNIIINTIIPVLFAYGTYHKDEKLKTRVLKWLEELPAEINSITTEFTKAGVENKSAYDSQALIELKNSYCQAKRCLDCSVGNYLLREAAHDYKSSNLTQLV